MLKHQVKKNKPDSEWQILFFSFIQNLNLKKYINSFGI